LFGAGKTRTTKQKKDHQGVVNRNEEALWQASYCLRVAHSHKLLFFVAFTSGKRVE